MHRWPHHLMLCLMHPHFEMQAMRTTVNLDDALLAEARRLTRIEERTALLHKRRSGR